MQPLSPIDLLKNMFVIYGKGFVKFIIPVIIVEAILMAIMYGISFWTLYANYNINDIGAFFVVTMLISIIYMIFNTLLVGFLYIIIASYKLTGKINLGNSLVLFRSRLLRLMGALGLLWLVSIGVSILGTLFLLIPIIGIVLVCLIGVPLMIYLLLRWIFVMHAVVIEGCGPGKAFTRSTNLIEDMWWSTFGMVLLLNVIPLAIACGLYYAFGLINPYLSVIGTILVTPLTAIGITLLYYDRRARSENVFVQDAVGELNPNYKKPERSDYSYPQT